MLLNRNGMYYFRVAIPLDLRKVFNGRTEIKKSLKTKSRKEAKLSHSLCQSKVESLFYCVRCGMISYGQADKIRSQIIAECIEDLHAGNGVAPNGYDFYDTNNHLSKHIFSKDQVIEALGNGKISRKTDILDECELSAFRIDVNGQHHIPPYIIHRAGNLIAELGLDVLKPDLSVDTSDLISMADIRLNKDFIELCVLVVKTFERVCYNEFYRSKGFEVSGDQTEDIIKMYKDGLPDPKFSELWEAYYENKMSKEEWITATAQKYTDSYKTVRDIIGDIRLKMFGSSLVISLTKDLKLYPKNKNKISQFKGLPYSKTMSEMSGFEPRSIKSVNFDLGMMSGLFNYANKDRSRWKTDNNPFLGSQIKVKKYDYSDDYDQDDSDKPRREFTVKEIEEIFVELSKVKRLVTPEYFWVPLICLYSGMRINEACQLRLKDIKLIDGIPVFKIRHIPKLFLSTKNGKTRTVPIHKTLQGLGLLEYVSRQKELKEERLFSKLKIYKDKWHKKVGVWFNRTVLRSHLKLGPDVTFHSTKHTFINWFKQNTRLEFTELSLLKAISAHFDDTSLTTRFEYGGGDGGITINLYGKKYLITALYDFINQLDYKIDLSILEQKKY